MASHCSLNGMVCNQLPRADVQELASAYFVEIEVPGLQAGNEDQVLVQWMTPRTVVVSGDIERAALGAE